MRFLVTGAAGLIGSHLCEELLRRGCEVTAMVHYNIDNIAHLKNRIRLVRADIRFIDECLEAVKGVDAVINLAAAINVDRSRSYPRLFWETNVLGVMNVLEACRTEEARLTHMTTCEVLGHIPHGKADENYPVKKPCSPYAASKYAAEAYCHAYISTYDLPVNIIRGFNICGPRQKKGHKGALIPIFVDKVLNGESPRIYGDGKQTRDYTDVRDMVRGIAEAASRTDLQGELIQLCSGVERSVNQIAKDIIHVSGSNLTPIHVESRPGELRRSVGDNSKAKTVLGWTPRIPFKTTIEDIIRFERRRLNHA